MATREQIAANRKNAKKSTGPKSEAGKDRARFNGLRHGLRAEEVVLPSEDTAEFQARVKRMRMVFRAITLLGLALILLVLGGVAALFLF